MGKIDNDRFKQLKEGWGRFRQRKSELVESEPHTFRLDPDLLLQATNLFEQISTIDETGIYSSNLEEFYFIAYDVTLHIGLYKLRANHRFWDGDHEYKIGDDLPRTKFLREEIVSDEELKDSIRYLWDAENYCKKWKTTGAPFELWHKLIHRIFHNLSEAYSALRDEDGLLRALDAGSKTNDVRCLEELTDHYCRNEEFSYSLMLDLFDRHIQTADYFIAKQKRYGVGTWNDDRKKWEKGNLHSLTLRGENPDEWEFPQVTLFASMTKLIDAFAQHSYYEKGLELAELTKAKCSHLSIWDGRYENEFDEKIENWQKLKAVNEAVLEPSDESLSPYFSESVLKMMNKDVRVFMGTSIYVFNALRGFNGFTLDYSPSIISLFKAIECVLHKIVIEEFYPFLVANRGKYKRVFASPVIYDRLNDSFHLPSSFSLANGLSVLVYRSKNEGEEYKVLNTGVRDFLVSFGIADPEDKLLQFYDDIESCRIYRNTTAHKERVTRDSAEEARKLILETAKIIEFAYMNFGPILTR